ncbi:chromosomal replication initiator protein DnaA [Spirochaetia bacterium]|nr:chromosomal replication initiator protein DnaA [Spirochaetia bacterium]
MTYNNSHAIIWSEVINQIKGELAEQEFLAWFNLEFQEADENSFTVSVPSAFYMDQVKKRYQSYIENKIETLIGKKTTLNLIIKPKNTETNQENILEDIKNPKNDVPAPVSVEKKEFPGSVKVPVVEKKQPHAQIRPDFTFENYVIGDKNRFAVSVGQAIARNPGTNYNPFLIYGGTGLGKTHLMQAIGNYIYQNSDHKLIYVSSETFINEFIAMISDTPRAKAEFKNKYRHNIDVLLIDDIQFFQGKGESQDEFFHVFNALSDAKKQIIFTCDRPISELKKFPDRLSSRMGGGINVELLLPSYETRCAILKKKAEAISLNFPNEVIDLLSKNILTNVRDLERAITTLSAYAKLLSRPITVQEAQEKLRDLLFNSSKQSKISMEVIQRVIADENHLSINDLKGKKRTQNIAYPRHLAMYIIRETTEYTTTEIGQEFGGRDHSTVMHACQKIEDRIKADPTMESLIQSLIRAIKDYSVKS